MKPYMIIDIPFLCGRNRDCEPDIFFNLALTASIDTKEKGGKAVEDNLISLSCFKI